MPRDLNSTEFDSLLETILERMPSEFRDLLDDVAIIVDDEPSPEMLEELGIDPNEEPDLCGLHSGIPLTERGVFEGAPLYPESIHIFRGPIRRLAGKSVRSLEKQIRITLLHEIGHHFGFDEEKLTALGYE